MKISASNRLPSDLGSLFDGQYIHDFSECHLYHSNRCYDTIIESYHLDIYKRVENRRLAKSVQKVLRAPAFIGNVPERVLVE